jgi:glycogen debranching enzyme
MDAKVGDWVVTPRRGKPVEIQALWYNALRVLEDMARRFQDELGQQRYGHMASNAKSSFNSLFWNDAADCLYDDVDGAVPDPAIRPNQIFAVSLPYSMLSAEQARKVVGKTQEHLLTPYGLRTLSPSDPQYRGRYTGGPVERDGAYHQGTVWPWLMGPFLRAYIKVHEHSAAARDQAAIWLEPLKNHLGEGGLGQISEILDGDAPRQPRGCIAQAWSVAEILRAYVEDVKQIFPSDQARSAFTSR